MLPPQRVTHRPPRSDIRMIALEDGHGAEAAVNSRRGAVIPFQLIQALQVEAETSATAVNVEGIRIAPARAEARRREHSHASVAKPRQETGVVIDRNLTQPGTRRTIFNEGCQHAGYGFDFPVEPQGEIDGVRAD